ncbi:hypothetical protein Poly30_35960 [Planctomycetes bacterium Poly30]|uniref:Uncharacterized protein n=1 Tax=Saltatorellus ferox TaxID=2528018 RepID=A0A518EVE1_9BACT|nr:hypothetical protein Poly30_35960 [Planctomycetes bacterium Poly30]
MSLVRTVISWGGAAALTWWILFHAPAPGLEPAVDAPAAPPLRTRLQPITEAAVPVDSIETAEAPTPSEVTPPPEAQPEQLPEPEPEPEPQPEPEPEAEPEPQVAAAELGTRDGDEEMEERSAPVEPDEPTEPEPAADPRPTATDLSRDVALQAQATRELSGAQASLGFTTTLISSPEDQLDIARAFGEDIVLVPRSALDDTAQAESFRLRPRSGSSSTIETLAGRPDLERSRQYRDLFAYDFQRLPAKIRELRRRVIRRDEVFLFAALIPASEWAVVIGRRQEACRAAGVLEDDVEQYILRYVRVAGGRFDFIVDEIRLASGERIASPVSSPRRSSF